MSAPHPPDIHRWYDRAVGDGPVGRRTLRVGARRVHLLETGDGPPLLLLHGSGVAASFFLPLLRELRGVRALAPDRPGSGLSEAADLRPEHYRERSVAWVDALLDALELDAVSLLALLPGGHAPWLGEPALTAATVLEHVRGKAAATARSAE